MSYHVGIDADTLRVAWVMVDGRDGVVDYAVLVRRKRAGDVPVVEGWEMQLAGFARWCARMEARVWLEGVYFKPALHGVARCGEAGHAALRASVAEVESALLRAGASVSVVKASTWQRAVLGRGLTREESKARALELVKNERWRCAADRVNVHLADARCIARYGVEIATEEELVR